MRILLPLLTFICGIWSSSGMAQRGFNDNERSGLAASSADFAVKLSPTQLLAGQFTLSFEQKIHDRGSLELSAGPTLGNIGFAPWIALGNNYFQGDSDFIGKLGYHFSLGYRYYAWRPDGAQLHGFYLSPVFKMTQFQATASNNQFSNPGFENFSEHKALLSTFTIQVGYQFIIGNGFVLDMYFGSGLGKRKVERNNVENYYDEGSQSNVTNSYFSFSKRMFTPFTTGLRLGFGGKYNSAK